MNKKEVKLLLKNLNISPKKHLGQNFLIDEQSASKIIEFSKVSNEHIVLEVGPGLGAITEKLIKVAQKVIGYEIDSKLFSFLKERFSNSSNLKFINQDILEVELPKHHKVVSNIPYSITGPLLEKLFFTTNPPEGNLLIEKNIADRIFYKTDYQNFSRITITVNSFMEPIKRLQISRKSFYPQPKINLSLIKLKAKKQIHPLLKTLYGRQFFLKFVAGIMPYKNKNLSNSINLFLKRMKISEITKDEIKNILKNNNYKDNKVSQLPIKEFPNIAEKIYHLINLNGV